MTTRGRLGSEPRLVAKTTGAKVTIDGDEIVIERNWLDRVDGGSAKNRRLRIAELEQVEFEPASAFRSGWIRFPTPGARPLGGSNVKQRLKSATKDDLAVTFSKMQQAAFEAIADNVRQRLADGLDVPAISEPVHPMTLVAKSTGKTVSIDGDEIVIEHDFLGRRSSRRLRIAEIDQVEFEPAIGLSSGWIRFQTPGAPPLAGRNATQRRKAARRDDLAVMFANTKREQAEFKEVADYVRRQIVNRWDVPATFEQISLPVIFEPVALVEPRSTGGRWKGATPGVSVPVPGMNLMANLGATLGQYQQGDEKLTIVDTGRFVIDRERAAFVGGKETRTWTYTSILGIQHEDGVPIMMINVHERERASGVAYREEMQEALWKTFQLAADHVLDARTTTVKDSAGEDRLSKLERLGALRASGVLTEEEFEAEKARLLGSSTPARLDPSGSSDTSTQADKGA